MGTNSINPNMLTGSVYGLATPPESFPVRRLPWLMPYGQPPAPPKNTPSLNSSANASVLFAAQLAGQKAR
jgi:hypothetical protein